MIQKICVAGAGTMGSGIALASAQNGFEVILFDTNLVVIEKAKEAIQKNLLFLSDKNKITPLEKESIYKKILFTSEINDCIADIIIEAIIEDISAKTGLFKKLSLVNTPACIFASNTSSLSISDLQATCTHPERVAGLHFFNPAQVMKLVEVVKGDQTADHVIETLISLSLQLGKKPVVCKDAPGFIVNRVARHYYLEAMKIVELGIATIENVDEIMEASGFKMGPFRLMDLIGMDINFAVSESLYNALDKPPRLKPSVLQADKVHKGELGRKSGKGFYDYKN